MEKVVIGTVASMPPGTIKQVRIRGRLIAVYNVEGTFRALYDRCPHQGACLSDGTVIHGWLEAARPGEYRFDRAQTFVRCPWHGWEYDLATGQSYFNPAGHALPHYAVAIERGSALLAEDDESQSRRPGPYVAETVPISVENDYVVVEV